MNEKRFRFTKSAVDALGIPTEAEVGTVGYTMVWDTQVIGFGLQLRPSGIKTFIFVYRNKGGRVRRLTIGRYGRVTVDQARDVAKRHNGVVALGGDPVADRKRNRAAKTIDELLRRYIKKHLIPNRSHDAVRSAKRVQRLISKGLGQEFCVDLDAPLVRNALEKFRKTPGNYNLVRTYVSAAWKWGRKFGPIPTNLANPVEDTEALPSTLRSRRITAAEYRKVFRAISELMAERRNDPARLLACAFVIATGCRPIEAVRLRRDQVSREREEAVLTEHKMFRRTATPKKFFLNPVVTDILDRAEALHAVRAVESEFVFPRRGEHKATHWLAKTWQCIRMRAGVDIELRQFRSGYINVADDAGLSLEQIAGITGHGSLETVRRHYLVVAEKRAARNAVRVAARIRQFGSKGS
jgi:integrase